MILNKLFGNIKELNNVKHHDEHEEHHHHEHGEHHHHEHGEHHHHAHEENHDHNDINHYHIETVTLEKEMECKNFKVKSDHNHEYEISIEGKILKDGDIILKDGHNMVVVVIATDEVLVIEPKSMMEMGQVAHSLGNRHLPAQFKNGKMLLQCDSRIEEILKSSNIEYSKEKVSLDKPFRNIDTGHIH